VAHMPLRPAPSIAGDLDAELEEIIEAVQGVR
jgi:hypothetical protein